MTHPSKSSIKEIVVEIPGEDGRTLLLRLPIDDARKLYTELHELFGKRETEKSVIVPYYGQPATLVPPLVTTCESTITFTWCAS